MRQALARRVDAGGRLGYDAVRRRFGGGDADCLTEVDVSGQRIEIESPIPVELDLGDGKTERHRAGRHTLHR